MIKNAQYVSVWNGGFELVSTCKINTQTHEIFDIQTLADTVDDDGDELDILDEEYVIIDGQKFPARNTDDDPKSEFDYWYK